LNLDDDTRGVYLKEIERRGGTIDWEAWAVKAPTIGDLAVTALAEILAGLTFFRLLRLGFGLRAKFAPAGWICARRGR
jgi:hypothetical protein